MHRKALRCCNWHNTLCSYWWMFALCLPKLARCCIWYLPHGGRPLTMYQQDLSASHREGNLWTGSRCGSLQRQVGLKKGNDCRVLRALVSVGVEQATCWRLESQAPCGLLEWPEVFGCMQNPRCTTFRPGYHYPGKLMCGTLGGANCGKWGSLKCVKTHILTPEVVSSCLLILQILRYKR